MGGLVRLKIGRPTHSGFTEFVESFVESLMCPRRCPRCGGSSGAAPFGALAAMMTMEEYRDLKHEIGLDENSRVLLFSTEGDTDPERYMNIVWKGLDR